MDGILLSYWQFWLLIALALGSLLSHFLLPSIRWILRKRVNRIIYKMNQTLDIKIRPFQLTKRKVLLDRLIFDPKVMQSVEEIANQEDVPRQLVQHKVKTYAHEIVPAFNAYIYYRLGYWIAKGLARWLYKVNVNVENIDLENVDTNATVVFVMNHRSNMDYILVSFLASKRTTLSYAVGEWAKIWPLHGLLKSMGAFFVRRDSRNPLYRRVLERYIAMATKEGVCQAMFPEGGLSRDGKLRTPKLGLLDYMLRNFDHENDRDVLFVPVGINYDRTLEDRTLLLSLEPETTKKSGWFAVKTTFKFLLNNLKLKWKHRWRNFGHAAVNFGAPVSAAEFSKNLEINFSTLEKQKRFKYIEQFSQELFEKVGSVVPVLPLSTICRVFQQHPEQLFSKIKLKSQALKLLEQGRQNGSPEVIEKGHLDDAYDEAIEMLQIRHLLIEEDGFYKANPKQKPLIAYYANSVEHWFESELNSK